MSNIYGIALKCRFISFVVILALITFASLGYSEDNKVNKPPKFGEVDTFTPIIFSVLAPPVPVQGSDGKFHIVYELVLTNSSRFDWKVLKVEALAGNTDGPVVYSVSGDEVIKKMRLIGTRQPTDSLEPAQSGIMFIAFPVDTKEDIPSSLLHRLTITSADGLPAQIISMLDLPDDQKSLTEFGAPVNVSTDSAVVLGPPLKGSGWIAANGCCDSDTHMRSDLPMNGSLYISQRFAIDWMKANPDNRLYEGDPKDLNNWFGYDQDVLAVADARVVEVVDKYEDQVPFVLPTEAGAITVEEIDGNHIVLELPNGQYAFYAHLKPGSIKVKAGDTVKRGDVIAKLGNTGNTSAPHLHLHVMETPLTIGSNGLPHRFSQYKLLGKTTEESFFDDGLEDNTPFVDEDTGLIEGNVIEILPVDFPGEKSENLPLNLRIVEFPQDR